MGRALLFNTEGFVDAELAGSGAEVEEHEPGAEQQNDAHCA